MRIAYGDMPFGALLIVMVARLYRQVGAVSPGCPIALELGSEVARLRMLRLVRLADHLVILAGFFGI